MAALIVMSTYNGAKYVRAQIESILAQMKEVDRLWIRDDGSTDDTAKVIRAIGDARIRLLEEVNVGFAASFLRLLHLAPGEFEVVLLADQDDVWLPGRIDAAVRRLGGTSTPRMTCSRLRLVDRNLEPLGLSPGYAKEPSFRNALIENIATGCTIALNRAAVSLLQAAAFDPSIRYHDWWIYLVVAAFGDVEFDPEPRILYRQHSGNAVGMGVGWGRYVGVLRSLLVQNWVKDMEDQARYFAAVYGGRLEGERRRQLGDLFLGNAAQRTRRLIASRYVYRQSWLGSLLFKTLVVANFIAGRIC